MSQNVEMAKFSTRNTQRARELRNTATPAERLLWQHLSKSQIGAKFCRQMPVGPFFADFLCREHKLIVELDGYSHEVRPEYDAGRDRYLVEQGYRVLRFANREVLENTEGVIRSIRVALGQS